MAFLLLMWPGLTAAPPATLQKEKTLQFLATPNNNFLLLPASPQPAITEPEKTLQFLATPNNNFLLYPSSPLGKTKRVGWMPEWGFRHDPEDLERRLRAQRDSAFNPEWLDRFLLAEEKARRRVGQVKSAVHRAALEEAIEQTAARVSEAIDAGWAAPEQLIIELEAAASAKRATASLKHAQLAIEMAQAILMEDEEILLLLG